MGKKPRAAKKVRRASRGTSRTYPPVRPALTTEPIDDSAFAQHRADVEREAVAAAEVAPAVAERLAAARKLAAATQAEIESCACELSRGGWSLRRIAEVAGVSHDTVKRWLAAEDQIVSPHDL